MGLISVTMLFGGLFSGILPVEYAFRCQIYVIAP